MAPHLVRARGGYKGLWIRSFITFTQTRGAQEYLPHRNRRLIKDGSPGHPPRLSHSFRVLTVIPMLCAFDTGIIIVCEKPESPLAI